MEKLTKKQKKELKKLEEQQKLDNHRKQTKTKTIGIIIGIIAFIVLAWLLITFAKEQNKIKIPPISSKDVLLGDKNAKVQLIEYADFDCPACAEYEATIEKLLSEENISYVYRFFPLTKIHKNARASAQAAYASYKQNKFLEMSDALYKNQESWGNLESVDEVFTSYAKEIGMDVEKFKKDYASDEVKQFIIDSENQALNLGLYSTPTFFVNGDLIEAQGPEALEEIIANY